MALVWIPTEAGTDPGRQARTIRSLKALGWDLWPGDLPPAQGNYLVARPGMWCSRETPPFLPGDPGRISLAIPRHSAEWRQLASRCGGLWARLPRWKRRFPSPPAAAFLGSSVGEVFRKAMTKGEPWSLTLETLVFSKSWQASLLADFEADHDDHLRIVQVVTSFQIGGAEKIALSLGEGLSNRGIPTLAIATGRGQRPEWPIRVPSIDLADSPEPMADLEKAARQFGADVLHTHLLTGETITRLSMNGWPVIVTLHNTPSALPHGMTGLPADAACLVLGCAKEVEQQWQGSTPQGPPSRTLWNGIQRPVINPASGRELKIRLGIEEQDVVLLALANERPQKRFDRLPALLAACQRKSANAVHLLVVGAGTESLSPLNLPGWHGLGLLEEVTPALSAADVLVSCSAHEGLSLSQLEALGAEKHVVATAVGGTSEVPGIRLVAENATPEDFADAVLETLTLPPPGLPKSFFREAMIARAAWLYERVLRQHLVTPPRADWWLVTNHFHTGGAQTSARRLLLEIHSRGYHVRVSVVEEDPHQPSPGTLALRASGITVHSAPSIQSHDAGQVCREVLKTIDASGTSVVVFWNLIASCKIILADALWRGRVYDVSPGEMFYSSLAQYFDRPRTGLPYQSPREYGRLLAGAVVKYSGEAEQARTTLECPVAVIPNGLPLPLPVARQPGTRLMIGTAARLSPDKRLEDLLDAVRLALPDLPPFELQIAGGPDGGHDAYAKALRRQAKGLPVRWLGELPETSQFLESCDLFVAISEPAGCPNATLEAMAAGLPVIATDHGGAREQIAHDLTGILVPARQAAPLAKALVRAARDPELRARLGRAARAEAERRFTVSRMADDYLAFVGISRKSVPAKPV